MVDRVALGMKRLVWKSIDWPGMLVIKRLSGMPTVHMHGPLTDPMHAKKMHHYILNWVQHQPMQDSMELIRLDWEPDGESGPQATQSSILEPDFLSSIWVCHMPRDARYPPQWLLTTQLSSNTHLNSLNHYKKPVNTESEIKTVFGIDESTLLRKTSGKHPNRGNPLRWGKPLSTAQPNTWN